MAKPEVAERIAQFTVDETQLGNYDGKFLKIFRKTRATLMDIIDDKSVGILEEDHARNITDEQIRAVAATGGVVGINGLNLYLGDGPATVEGVVRHIDYVAKLVGTAHVGIALDSDPSGWKPPAPRTCAWAMKPPSSACPKARAAFSWAAAVRCAYPSSLVWRA